MKSCLRTGSHKGCRGRGRDFGTHPRPSRPEHRQRIFHERHKDHNRIKRWAEKRGGVPSSVVGTGTADEAGILRLDFEPKDEKLDAIDWDEFFQEVLDGRPG